MEKKNFWTVLCGSSTCSSEEYGTSCFSTLIDPNSCVNHILIVVMYFLILLICLSTFICARSESSLFPGRSSLRQLSKAQICATIFNSFLGLAYLVAGISIFSAKISSNHSVMPLHPWVVLLFQGCIWLLLNLIVILKKQQPQFVAAVKLCPIMALLLSVFLCSISIWEVAVNTAVSVYTVLDILSLPGAVLFVFCAFCRNGSADADQDVGDSYAPLLSEETNGDIKNNSDDDVTPFATAGCFSKLTFWWLNPLMSEGNKNIIEDEDIPKLRKEDSAKTCYSMYIAQLNKLKKEGSSDSASVLYAIYSCHRKEIFISGFFALVKVITLLSGPLLLKAFILTAEYKGSFEYEGYVLTVVLFTAKILESVSERQWYFRTRLIGVKVKSQFSAAIYQKQLRLSNAAKAMHSPGEIVNYVAVDSYKLGEFPSWMHQIWGTCLQMILALAIVYYAVGLATVAALIALILTMLACSPLTQAQLKFHTKLMELQDRRLKAMSESLSNMKVLKLYAWESHFRKVIEGLRNQELWSLIVVLFLKGCQLTAFWSTPIIVSTVTFWTCYFLGIELDASSVFTFLATLRCVQEPIRLIPDIATTCIEAKVSLDRISKFLASPELEHKNVRKNWIDQSQNLSILVRCSEISWDTDVSMKATLAGIDLMVKPGQKVAICGEVGSGKSTLLAAVLGEVPRINGTVQVYGKIAYVSQNAWMQTGSVRENILFGSSMDRNRYQEVLERCSLVKDIESFPFGDLTELGEKGVNLSGGQKQRVQLARALYQNADVYLLDDPFSAVDAHTATNLFNEYVMGALTGKTVLLVTHQVDFLPAFDCILMISAGRVLRADTYDKLMESCLEFQELVNAHNSTVGSETSQEYASSSTRKDSEKEIQQIDAGEKSNGPAGNQLIKKEEKETGDVGFKPYIQYLRHGHAFLYSFLGVACHFLFIIGQLVQILLLALYIRSSHVSRVKLFAIYTEIGALLAIILLFRSLAITKLGGDTSRSIFFKLLNSLFRAPMSFYDSTPLGRIFSRVSSDLNVIDLDLALRLSTAFGNIINAYSSLLILAVLSWPVVFLIVPMVYLSIVLQRYYFNTARELMRINGTTRSSVVSHFAESIAGAMTIKAFGEEDRFFLMNLKYIDRNSSAYFHSFAATEWLIQRLEAPCAVVLSVSALAMTLLPIGTSNPGFVGMALSYGLSLNVFFILCVQLQCQSAESIISVERLEQYTNIQSEAPEVIDSNRPPENWPNFGRVEFYNLKVRYQAEAPLVLDGISCIIEGGNKIGIVGRTGSGKTTLISTLFRLVEPTEGKVIVDGIDISTIGLHDLRSHFGVIPQEPTLFSGSVRYNLDPLSQYTDSEIWEVLEKCQLREVIQQKKEGLSAVVAQDGTNWSMGQRQLFCLGRALLKRSRILVLDEATASIDNSTDAILQKTIRTEFAECTVITVAHRIPTVMDCTKVLVIRDGKIAEYDEPQKLISKEDSLFGQLVKEYWSRTGNNY